MKINELILRNLKKNIKNYYLYVFALVFSAALYFAFVTLQYDPSLDETKGTVKGAAAIRSASILLVAIVSIFLLYANNIFIKRRSKEIGLFQLIGMTKGKIFHILNVENLILYYVSLALGIFVGFAGSKLILMILFKITGIKTETTLRFSSEALLQTVVIFTIVYLLIMLMNYLFIKRQTILSLFRVISSTEGKLTRLSFWQVLVGVAGILLIIVGYYVSSKLFSGDFSTTTELFLAMTFILASVIFGTYLFFKGSVSFIFHLIRKAKKGYLNINEVLSLSSLMFRMKSNALLLTIITTVSALALALLSLSYISYYSAETKAKNYVVSDFALTNEDDAELFKGALEQKQIPYTTTTYNVIQVEADLNDIILEDTEGLYADVGKFIIPVISDKETEDFDLTPDETIFTGYDDLLQRFMEFADSGKVVFKGKSKEFSQKYKGLKKDFLVSWQFTGGGVPVAIVDESIFTQLSADLDPAIQKSTSVFVGFDLKNEAQQEHANQIFEELFNEDSMHSSQIQIRNVEKGNMGLVMFIVAFLGLTFLITSGCILYFKQMGESEEEKPNYTILRKLGFSKQELIRGIKYKQLFNFGIPLLIGLLHSYFAVQSGWFLFGTELWTPIIIVMAIYTVLYSIFGFLSLFYYKKVIKLSL
ncbi:ABC transporter permease [Robertmurraya sp. DFI.2.37]|uniref:FtsX-like permease family protein n=1 Tax=Robertmurraya sp. DFI.2.37 TaxID=3031819 RepID=UPI0012492353|nr:ABC transporter permease [Robertmurraya sp. DFI.2.37]MDF1507150.1 ABC transporter permease [Robertmurraya sp. DFI.2.37]